ncbi:electron transport complex subunit RsxC [Parashewanella spongiae]|uniref:Ion-translocating oxidoreductase complex subunit C n=1 Tax=Parashewanella spongiae TaxID=342950 RepID=A0A3A6TQJ4_9GAMM|nr:electron transport complex subunit RsxC [Parashewanella spongiae]MCL1078440.1 electron transport complex subunit RsxC [Parashewanella spongiae]RJY14845.1 electron transport complex subunit RsxC [Parashewanella spongiae]
MLTLLDQIDQGTLWPVPGGIHPQGNKRTSNQTHIERIKLASEYVIPIPTLGQNCTLAVKVGTNVFKGTPLTEGAAHLPSHSPTSGTVVAIEPRPSNHPSGILVVSVVISADGKDQWDVNLNCEDYSTKTNNEILKRIQQSGIAGMGGAAFPSHIKLDPVSDVELVIINGVECEPYITSDDRLMREYSDDIIHGIEIINRLIEPERIVIAIEDNKPEAIKVMAKSLAKSEVLSPISRVTSVPTKYPSGGEKQLIQIITGKEVPSGGIPAQLGVLVHNVATAKAIAKAVVDGKPLIERVVTVTGESLQRPGNYWVPIGTPVEHLLRYAEYKEELGLPIIVGGPMMGYELRNPNAPILKGSNCILAPSSNEMTPEPNEKACIRCGECAVACPAKLLPQQLFWHSKAEEYDKAASYNLKDCIECGCCSYVCPSDIPLVEYYRVAKSAIKAEAQSKLEAEQAKKRFDERLARLEKEKLAREEKSKQAAARRQSSMSGKDKNAVAEALARIQAKKSTQEDDSQSKVAAAIARAKAKKLAANKSLDQNTEIESNGTQDRKENVAAAIARAKAKKLATSEANDTNSESAGNGAQDKKEKIAAAVARAKAKKLAASKSIEANSESADNSAQAKKEQIAAAVAKAKTKKQAKLDAQNSEALLSSNKSETNEVSPANENSDKKAKIAAAVAKAKLRAKQKTAAKAADEEQ